MSQPLREGEDGVEAWRDLQAVLEARDREWWAKAGDSDEE